mmetsp:Transcript_23253/g.65167  ORF Transcript_23253/g.65167 Transcript_23253/m.65167 type:complete len:250 (-) Transcript_23253:523-1272(-)
MVRIYPFERPRAQVNGVDLVGRNGPFWWTEGVQDVELDDVDQLPGPLQITKKRREDARPEPRLRHARLARRVLYDSFEALQGVVRLEGHVAAARAQHTINRRDHGRVPLQQQRDAVVRVDRPKRLGDRADGVTELIIGVLLSTLQAGRTRVLLRRAEHEIMNTRILGPRLPRLVRFHHSTQVVVVLDHQVVHGQGVAFHQHGIHIRLRLDEEALRGSFSKEIAPVPQTELAVRGHELKIQELAAEFVCR